MKHRSLLGLVAAAAFMQMLASTIVNTALPAIAAKFLCARSSTLGALVATGVVAQPEMR